MNYCSVTFRKFLQRVTLRSTAPPSRNSTRMTVCCMSPQALHNSGRLKWASGPRGGVPAYTGEDVIIVRDEKIAALYVFLDSPAA